MKQDSGARMNDSEYRIPRAEILKETARLEAIEGERP